MSIDLQQRQTGLPIPISAEQELFTPPQENRTGTVELFEVVRIAFDSLLANKMRSLLTMLGVIIGVASVVALLAIGQGASDAITGQVEAIGTNVLTIAPGTPGGNRGPGSGGNAVQTLTLGDAEAIAALNLPVSGVAPQFGAAAQIVAPAADAQAQVIGVTPAYQLVNNLELASGSFIREADQQGASAVVVLGSNLASELFGSGQALGQRVRIQNQTLTVVGVLAERGGSAFGSVDDQAFVPLSVAHQRLFGGRTPDGNAFRVTSITVSALDSAQAGAIQGRIEQLLRTRHNLAVDGSEDDFQVLNQASFLDTLSTITTLLTVFLASIAGISLLVGGIGIMNIMLVSVSERTREIGLRKAVGARGSEIMLQFVVEALVISLVGGLIGLGLGALIPALLSLSGLLEASVSLSAVLVALGFALAVGLFFGIYPARRAALLNPIEALRHE